MEINTIINGIIKNQETLFWWTMGAITTLIAVGIRYYYKRFKKMYHIDSKEEQ